MVGPPGVEPGTNGLCLPLRLSPPLSGLQSGLSLSFTLHPYSLYTFPLFREGFARDCHATPKGAEVSPNLSGSTNRQS